MNDITLRDYLAGLAMNAYISPDFFTKAYSYEESELFLLNLSAFSYRAADAMLQQRIKLNNI